MRMENQKIEAAKSRLDDTFQVMYLLNSSEGSESDRYAFSNIGYRWA